MATEPVTLAVDDDGDVLRLIKGDLRQLSGRDETVALLVVDQRMPGMGGVDFLEQAIKLDPRC